MQFSFFANRMFQELKISHSISGLTFSTFNCTVAVGNAAQNCSNSVRNVSRKKAAQVSLVQLSLLAYILWFVCLKKTDSKESPQNSNKEAMPIHYTNYTSVSSSYLSIYYYSEFAY